jgi:Uma2 family endonuclease
MNSQAPRPTGLVMDNAAFLAWAEGREGRYELVGGRVTAMMTGATKAHRVLTTRLLVMLAEQLDGALWHVNASDCAVDVRSGDIRYPDIVVERDDGSPKALAAEKPTLVVEILSPSSISTDLGDKAAEYMSIPSVADYLVLSQDGPKGWHYAKGAPAPRVLAGREVVLDLAAVGARIDFARLYKGFADMQPDAGDAPPARR